MQKIIILLILALFASVVRGQNIALNKPVTTSSNDGSGQFPGSNAVDGNTSTRWASDWSDPQWIAIDLQATYNVTQVILRWETAAAKAYQIQVSADGSNWTSIYTTTTGAGGVETLNITGTGRYIRMYGTQRATSYGYSLYEFEVYGTVAASVPVSGVTLSPAPSSVSVGNTTQLTATVSPSNATNSAITWSSSNASVATVNSSGLVTGVAIGTATITATTQDGSFTATSSVTVIPAPVNIALKKPVTTSTDDASGSFPGSNAVDGNPTTRWGSVYSDPQWIDVDLQAVYNINQVILRWETAAAKAYLIQVSYDNVNWTTIYSTTTGPGGVETLSVAGTGRYIRMYGTVRATVYGYSLYEFEVYGTLTNVPVSGVAISPATSSVLAGGRAQLSAIISPANATHNDVTWSTSDSTIVKVNSYGEVIGVAPGNATITATTVDGGKTGTAAVTVVKVPVTGVSLATSGPVYVGGSTQLTAVISPSNATNKGVSWTSSNPAVATIDASGLVTGKTAGSTTITVTTDDGQFNDNATYKVTVASSDKYKVGVSWSSEYLPGDASWFTTSMQSQYKLAVQDSLALTLPTGTSVATTFNVNPAVSYQTIYGMGSSFEESTVYNLLLLSQAKRTEALKLLCDPVNGIGLNLWRLTIGTSDFTGRDWYTYDDMPDGQSDTSLSKFSIQKDIDYGIVQVIKEAQAINPSIRFFASAWSPPAWMKAPASLLGGTLADGMYASLAKYYRKFVEAYAAQGIPIYAITVQNEPGQVSSAYPTTILTVAQEIALTKAIKTEFNAHGITTKVWLFDYNFSNESFPASVLADPGAYQAADGTAFHDYSGSVTAMSDLHSAYPDKDVFLTERSFWGIAGMDNVAQYFRNYACTYNSWVTMLDANKKPNNGGGSIDPTLLVKGTASSDQYWAIPEVYLFGQYAKYVQVGAKRIDSEYGSSGGLTNVAFQNPDGSIAMVVMNNSSAAQIFKVLCEGSQFIAQLPGKTAGTYVWQSGLPASVIVPDTATASKSTVRLVGVYPNPVTNNTVKVFAVGFNRNERVNISVYDLSGRKISESAFNADNYGNLETSVKFSQLVPNHMYVISIKGDAHNAIGRKLITQ